jgi:2-oxoglutarate ferredoxin oxidoreductase subunit alpha
MAFEAARIAVEHMTPVILLTDGFIANGSSAWRIPEANDYPAIKPNFIKPEMLEQGWKPYMRNEETKVRYWAVPGTEGFMHRLGGLEKDYNTSAISTDPINHEKMVATRKEKVAKIANNIPAQQVQGNPDADTLLIGWGGTYGHLYTAAKELLAEGKSVGFAHFDYINPLPKNTKDVFKRFKKIIVCELNSGQFVNYLRAMHPEFTYNQLNKVQGQPFIVKEIVDAVHAL